jgi:hypothetical protein
MLFLLLNVAVFTTMLIKFLAWLFYKNQYSEFSYVQTLLLSGL